MGTATKRRWQVGDRAWNVEWCSHIPLDENGDSDMDNAKEESRLFADHESAMACAKEVFPQDQFGCVTITPVEKRAYDDADAITHPHVGFWEAAGETEEYCGEDETP